MPFKSRSQLGVCYSRRTSLRDSSSRDSSKRKSWNCDEWLDKTPSVCCLPYRKGDPVKTRCMKKGERIIGKVQTGERGGRYFTITEKDKKGLICTVKVYLPKK
jgi:hypothetical protein